MKRKHIFAYVIEFLVICSGFTFILMVNPPIYIQFFLLGSILIAYIILGLIHHKRHHDITVKIVLEYVLISAIVFALFIFLNIGRI